MAFKNWEDDAYERALAESSALRKNALSTQGQMAGRVFVPKSPWQNFAEGLAGGSLGGAALLNQRKLDEARQAQTNEWMGQMPEATTTATLPDELAGPVGTYQKPHMQQAQEMRQWATKGAALPSAIAQAAAAKGMDYAMTAPQRQAEMEERQRATDAAREAQRIQAAELQAERLSAQAERERERREAQAQRDADQRALRLTLAQMAQSGREKLADKKAETAKDAPAAKPLPPHLEKSAVELGANYKTMENLESSFKDDYAGGKLKQARVAYGETLGGTADEKTQEMTRWWADQKMFDELPQRHKLFGAALTPTEMASWKAAAISPSLDPKVIKDRMAERKRIYADVAERTRGMLEASGRNVNAYDAATSNIGNKAAAPAPAADPNAEALAWLAANPNHPKAAAVRARLGAK